MAQLITKGAPFRDYEESNAFKNDVARMWQDVLSVTIDEEAVNGWKITTAPNARPMEGFVPPTGYVSEMPASMPFVPWHYDLARIFDTDIVFHDVELTGTLKALVESIVSDTVFVDVISSAVVSAAESLCDEFSEIPDLYFDVTFNRDVSCTLYRKEERQRGDSGLCLVVSLEAQVVNITSPGETLQEYMEACSRDIGGYLTVGMLSGGNDYYHRRIRGAGEWADAGDAQIDKAVDAYRVMSKAYYTLSQFYDMLSKRIADVLDDNMAERRESLDGEDVPTLSLDPKDKTLLTCNVMEYEASPNGDDVVKMYSECYPPPTDHKHDRLNALVFGGPYIPALAAYAQHYGRDAIWPREYKRSDFGQSMIHLEEFVKEKHKHDDWHTSAASRTYTNCKSADVSKVLSTVRGSHISKQSILKTLGLEWRSDENWVSPNNDGDGDDGAIYTVVSFNNFDMKPAPEDCLVSTRSKSSEEEVEEGPPRLLEEIPTQYSTRTRSVLQSADARPELWHPILHVRCIDDYDLGLLKVSNQYRNHRDASM